MLQPPIIPIPSHMIIRQTQEVGVDKGSLNSLSQLRQFQFHLIKKNVQLQTIIFQFIFSLFEGAGLHSSEC